MTRMTDEDIDCFRRIGRDEEERSMTHGLAEIDALCTEAKLRGGERDAAKRRLAAVLEAFDNVGCERCEALHDLNPRDLFGPHTAGCRACVLEAAIKRARDSTDRKRVVSAVIVQAVPDSPEPRVLLTLRDGRSDYPDHWECPGGKVEEGETDAEALRRELAEELGGVWWIKHYVGSVDLDPPTVSVPLCVTFYHASLYLGTPFPKQAKALGRFTAAEMKTLPLMPANRALADVVGAFMASGRWRKKNS